MTQRHTTRLAFVLSVALLPLVLAAQGARPQAPPVPAGATSIVMPFSGPGWQDAVLAQEGYVQPPRELADAVLAPRFLNVTLGNLSPDKKWFLNQIGDGPVVMKTFSKPFHELGGVFIDYKASRARSLTISNGVGIQILSATDGSKRAIQIPAGARVSNATWSPDSANIAFFVHTDDATHIWIADVATGKARQLTTAPVLATLVSSFDFTEDGKQIAVVLVPDQRSPMPQDRPSAPTGPEVKIALGSKASLRTFPSLMHTPNDYALLEWHATGQAALVDVATRAVRKIGAPAMFRAIDVSPNGQFLRATRMTKPFSYIVPVASFGQVEEVWDLTGAVLAKLTERPINLGAQPDDPNATPDPNAAQAGAGGGRGNANQNGKRELAWRADGAGFSYLEQEPAPAGTAAARGAGGRGAGGGRQGGGQGTAPQGPPRPDRLMQWLPPYDATSTKLIFENPTRMTGHRFSPDMKVLFFSESSGAGQTQTTTDYAVYLQDPTQRYTLARHTAQNQNVVDPGSLLSTRSAAGGRAGGAGRGGGAATGPVQISSDGTSVFYQGTIYDKNPQDVGPKTFLDNGIGHHGNCSVVDLKVPATFIVEIPNLGPVRRRKIRPELLDIAIRLFQRVTVGTAVQHCWRRHCKSGNNGRDGFEKTEMVEHARLRSADFSLNHHRGGLLFGATELRIPVCIARVRQLDALKTVKKIDMPPVSPELSIGHNLEADSFLQCDCFPDAFVFDSLKSRNVDFPLTGICPCLMEFGRPQ